MLGAREARPLPSPDHPATDARAFWARRARETRAQTRQRPGCTAGRTSAASSRRPANIWDAGRAPSPSPCRARRTEGPACPAAPHATSGGRPSPAVVGPAGRLAGGRRQGLFFKFGRCATMGPSGPDRPDSDEEGVGTVRVARVSCSESCAEPGAAAPSSSALRRDRDCGRRRPRAEQPFNLYWTGSGPGGSDPAPAAARCGGGQPQDRPFECWRLRGPRKQTPLSPQPESRAVPGPATV